MVRSLTLIQAFTHLNLLLSLFSGVIDSSLRFFAKETAKMIELCEETYHLWTRCDIRFRFTCERYGLTQARKPTSD